MIQDKNGLIWFGTGDGLYKYDSYSYTTYRHDKSNPHSLSNDYIQSIAQGKSGDLWIGTLGGGLSRYDYQKDRFETFSNDPSNAKTLISNEVLSVCEDSKGRVWVGTMDGLDLFDPTTKTFTHFNHDARDSKSIGSNHITHIYEDSEKNIWISTMNGGLNLLNYDRKDFTRFQNSSTQNSISSNSIHTVFEDEMKRLWIGTRTNGIDLLDRKSMTFTNIKNNAADKNSLVNNSVRSITQDRNKNLWIGTENGGISIYDPKRNSFQNLVYDPIDNFSIASNAVNVIFNSRKGNMWVGTFNAGFCMMSIDAANISLFQHSPLRNSLSNNKVLCFLEDSNKKIWIGTDGGGLNKFDPTTGLFSHFKNNKSNNSIASDFVLTLCEDSKGNIWVGTWGNGVSVYNPKNNTYRHFKNIPNINGTLSNDNAWVIFEDSKQNIWIGTYGGGLNLFNPATNNFTAYQYDPQVTGTITDNWINCIYEDREGSIWVGTAGGGLNKLNADHKSFTPFQPIAGKNSIGHTIINSIFEDNAGRLWIGTPGGLNLYERKSNTFSIYDVKNGLPGNSVFGILQDENNKLWISTDNGISCFDPATRVIKNIGMSSVLQSRKFKEKAYLKAKDGTMYFGGNQGFNSFQPGNIELTKFEAPLIFTEFKIFNKNVPITIEGVITTPLKENINEARSITLSYKQSFFSFSFASLDYSNPDNKKYAYMLEGFDDTWNEIGSEHTATYTNLDPGKYVFKVKSTNNLGEWSENIKSIELIIKPPFWLTWWFRIGVILLVGGAITGFYLIRINAVKKQRRILEEKVAEQTGELKKLNEEERKARKEADEANLELERKNRELEQFVYIASHDLQEPLRTTNSFLDLFVKQYKGKLDDKADSILSFVTQATARMRTLINDLLDYSRLGADAEKKSVDSNKLLAEIRTDLGTAITESETTIYADSLPVVNGFPTALKQLFQNLITNAIKFRKPGVSPEIRIAATDEGEFWKFTFTDNGIGIEKKYSEKIFAIFQRLHSRNEYEGSGIGLAHCKKIVEMHKGTITVESQVGIGSTFIFTIKKA
jgi:ligand-binding sensor domain-containing protein/signal transduction histidine kinase